MRALGLVFLSVTIAAAQPYTPGVQVKQGTTLIGQAPILNFPTTDFGASKSGSTVTVDLGSDIPHTGPFDDGSNFDPTFGVSNVPNVPFDWTDAASFTVGPLSGDADLLQFDDPVELWPSFPTPAASTTTRLLNFDATATKSNGSNPWYLIDISPTLTWTTTSGDYVAVRAGGTLTNTAGPSGAGYQFTIFKSSLLLQSSGSDGDKPFLPDTFTDLTTVSHGDTTAATESAWVSVSLVAQQVIQALGSNYTMANTAMNVAGMYFQPTFDAASGKTMTVSGPVAAVFVRAHGATGSGTKTLSGSYAGLWMEDPTSGSVDFTNNYSVKSFGTTTALVNAGPVRIGDTTNPTEKLEVAGNVLATGTSTVQGATHTFGTTNSPTFSLGTGGSGTNSTTMIVNAGTSGTTAGSYRIQRDATDLAQFSNNGTNTFIDYGGSTGTLNLRAGFVGTTRLSLTSLGFLTLTNSAVDTEAFRIVGTATNDDPNYRVFPGRTTTTGNATAAINTFATTTGEVYLAEMRAIGKCTSGSSCTAGAAIGCIRRTAFDNIGGTLHAAAIEDDGDGAYLTNADVAGTCDMAISGTNIVANVIGVANENYTWHSVLIIQSFNT